MARTVRDQGGILQMFNEDFHTYMFTYFLLQEEPKRVHQALKDPSWIEAMQEELLQFKMQKVWILVDLPYRKRAIGTKWVCRNKKDKRGIVIRNKARLVAQGHIQEEGIDYEEGNLVIRNLTGVCPVFVKVLHREADYVVQCDLSCEYSSRSKKVDLVLIFLLLVVSL
nr:ribonuclease H-like domain, reverse transcriptase, RNA-dependent DNA polymerase [Tanacetum cinerariifolium]